MKPLSVHSTSASTFYSKEEKIMQIPDPYPSQYSRRDSIADFVYHDHLQLARLKDRGQYNVPSGGNYIVSQDYRVTFTLNKHPHEIIVPRGMLTDLASVPRIFRCYVGRVGTHLEATIVHDWLYVAWQGASYLVPQLQPIPKARTDDMRHFADNVMHHAMLASGMRGKAHVIHGAIRCGGRCIYFDKNPTPLGLSDAQLKAEGL